MPYDSTAEIIREHRTTAPCADGETGGLDVDPLASVIKNALITNVGGAGYYDNVVDMEDGDNMECPDFDAACIKEVRKYSGSRQDFPVWSIAGSRHTVVESLCVC